MCINFTTKGDSLHVAQVAVCSLLGAQDGHPPTGLVASLSGTIIIGV